MTSPFDVALGTMDAAIDANFGEGFLLLQQEHPAGSRGRPDVNLAPTMSTTRPAIPFRGVFFAKGALVYARGRGMALDSTTPMSAERPMIEIERDRLPTTPRPNDRLTRNRDGRGYSIASITYEEDRYLRLWLNEA